MAEGVLEPNPNPLDPGVHQTNSPARGPGEFLDKQPGPVHCRGHAQGIPGYFSGGNCHGCRGTAQGVVHTADEDYVF